MEIISHHEQDTIAAAQTFARTLKAGDVVAFYGDLGAGKSVLCRAIIRTLSAIPDLNVPSPTFSLVQTYETPACEIWHFDFYRLEHPEELYELGWEEALSGHIVLIEWPERIPHALPAQTQRVTIEDLSETTRRITIEAII